MSWETLALSQFVSNLGVEYVAISSLDIDTTNNLSWTVCKFTSNIKILSLYEICIKRGKMEKIILNRRKLVRKNTFLSVKLHIKLRCSCIKTSTCWLKKETVVGYIIASHYSLPFPIEYYVSSPTNRKLGLMTCFGHEM